MSEQGNPPVSKDPFYQFWNGHDPQLHQELCKVLDEAGVPFRNVARTDPLLYINYESAYHLSVPISFFGRAEAAVQEAFGVDEETGNVAVLTLPPPLTPEEIASLPDEFFDWSPDAATVEIGHTELQLTLEKIEELLGEKRIHFRWVKVEEKNHIFVQPEDEERAREILREVSAGKPPE